MRHEYIGTEHLLLAILGRPEDPASAVLVDAGLDRETARRAVRSRLGDGDQAQALAAIGVDLGAVREGEGHGAPIRVGDVEEGDCPSTVCLREMSESI
ncbi:Clp protease N-terminal domain-containing protein [Kitasatospora sp. NPDC056783]|uniref:Clp protease N-terminal domain-containing protein n=1 Tax=Kitasatospora sp. NPDC056783 TaxID=3345943 RepID=UPI003693B6BE